jgi:superfamily II DNA or RNA helicase
VERLTKYRFVDGDSARSSIARLILKDEENQSSRLGGIELQPHQVSAVSLLRNSIDEFGGVLLCDPVGTGKTYVALALIGESARTIVIAPAILRSMWTQAASLAGRTIDFASFESLSRGKDAGAGFQLVIVDEAHHARNPATRRYSVLSRIASGAEVVLLTATPVHNDTRDLRALLSLFLGKRAEALTGAELSRCVIRRGGLTMSVAGLPAVDPLQWFRIREDSVMPGLLLSLPPPVSPRDGGDGGVLIAHSLIRQWASSDAALNGAIQRRLIRAESLAAALLDGMLPSTSELSSWIAGDDAVQLGFSSMLSAPAERTDTLLRDVKAHARALREIRHRVRTSSSDADRAQVVRRIRLMHAGERIVAFSQYADTVAAMFARLCRDGEVAALSGTGARVAGGSIGRKEAIERFAPLASGRLPPRRSERITLLLATDLISEGLNLQDAAVVVHLDLPWTPARMEQRLGRSARARSRHQRVHSYAIHPPASAEEIARIETILREKMRAAGIATAEFPSLKGWRSSVANAGEPAISDAIRKELHQWVAGPVYPRTSSIACALASESTGFLALVLEEDRGRLIASIDGIVTEEPRVILRAIRLSEGADRTVAPAELQKAEAELHAFFEGRDALGTARVSSIHAARFRNAAVRRLNAIVQNSRVHSRNLKAIETDSARAMLLSNLDAHQEMELERLEALADDDEWVNQLAAICRSGRRTRSGRTVPVIEVVLLLGRGLA